MTKRNCFVCWWNSLLLFEFVCFLLKDLALHSWSLKESTEKSIVAFVGGGTLSVMNNNWVINCKTVFGERNSYSHSRNWNGKTFAINQKSNRLQIVRDSKAANISLHFHIWTKCLRKAENIFEGRNKADRLLNANRLSFSLIGFLESHH